MTGSIVYYKGIFESFWYLWNIGYLRANLFDFTAMLRFITFPSIRVFAWKQLVYRTSNIWSRNKIYIYLILFYKSGYFQCKYYTTLFWLFLSKALLVGSRPAICTLTCECSEISSEYCLYSFKWQQIFWQHKREAIENRRLIWNPPRKRLHVKA